MKDDPYGVPAARSYAAHPMPQVHPIGAPRTLDRTMMHSECDCIPPMEVDNLRPGLHAGPLLSKNKLSPSEICARLRQEDRDLNWEHLFSIEVLVEAVVIPGPILKKQGSWLFLAGFMAPSNKVLMIGWVPRRQVHRCIPTIGNRRQFGVKLSA